MLIIVIVLFLIPSLFLTTCWLLHSCCFWDHHFFWTHDDYCIHVVFDSIPFLTHVDYCIHVVFDSITFFNSCWLLHLCFSWFHYQAMIKPFLDRFLNFLVKINTEGSPLLPCGSQWNHLTKPGENGHNSAIPWLILDLFGTNEHKRIPSPAMWFSMELPNLSWGKWPKLSHSLTDFGSFWYKWTQKYPLSCHVVLNGITQPLWGIMAITQPLLDWFWIFLVQMNTKGSHFIPCGSWWNHTTSQGENGCNSAISWPILDIFGINELKRNPSPAMWFLMESHIYDHMIILHKSYSHPITNFYKFPKKESILLLPYTLVSVVLDNTFRWPV